MECRRVVVGKLKKYKT